MGAGSVALTLGVIGALPTSVAASSRSAVRMHPGIAGMDGMAGMDHSSATLSQQDTSQRANAGVVNMEGDFYKRVTLPPKAGATAKLDAEDISAFERTIACPCPCTLDVYTCRTTDFTCGNSPAVHRDVQEMVKGGYDADEILKAMVGVYGNDILMAPPKTGINLIAWFLPFAALGTGAVILNSMLHKWRKNSVAAPVANDVAVRNGNSGATNDELERLRAAMRDDNR